MGIEYDGCTDNCEIEQDFVCQVKGQQPNNANTIRNPFTEKMVCSYNKPVELEIESIERNKFENKLKMRVSVYPNLHVFRSVDFSDLVSISHSFSIDSVSFDQTNSYIDLVVSFEEDINDTEFNISFVPKEQYDERFFATQSTTIPFKVDSLTFYSHFALTVSKVTKTLCIVIVALCWTNAVLGFMAKRLAAMESFLCCQIAFQMFLWIKSSFNFVFT